MSRRAAAPRGAIARVLDLIERGAYDVARAELTGLGEIARADPDALTALALLARADGRPEQALAACESAQCAAPARADLRANLAAALLEAGRVHEALAQVEAALAIDPRLLAAWITAGAAHFARRAFDAARSAFEAALALDAACIPGLNGLADCLREAGELTAAQSQYRRALALDRDDVHANTNLGPLLIDSGQAEQALAHCRRATELAPEDGRTWLNLGYCLAELDRIDEAMDAFAEAHERLPDSALLACHIAELWLEIGDLVQAQRWVDRAEAAEPGRLGNRVAAAQVLLAGGEPEQARGLLEPLLREHPERVPLWLTLARARWDDGDARGAVDACERALALHPALARAHVSIGEVLASAGDLTGAAASYRRALTLNPHCVGALVGLAGIDRDALPPAQLATMRRLVAAGWLPEPARVSLHAALAQHADASGHVAEAVAQLSAANALQWERRSQRDWRYDPAEFRGFVDRLIGTFDAAHFARWVGAGATTDVPVFVVGMPRSGTTLTEQILAAHPLVLGAGERGYAQRGLQRLPALLGREGDGLGAVGALDATAIAALADWHLGQLRHLVARDPRGPDGIHRVVDKMPDNVLWLGWIATLFPRAKIVHLSRDPRDIAVSCWITSFAELPWACRLEHIAERYVDKERIMAHWRRVLPLPIHELRYEALVEDPETEARRLLAYLGLPWDAACLEFQGAPRLVRTASVLQVRRPLSRRSVARWRRYAAALSPLLDRLGRAGLLPDDP